jgi:hypothetical protein
MDGRIAPGDAIAKEVNPRSHNPRSHSNWANTMPRVTLGSFSVDAPADWTLSTVILAGPVEDQPEATGLLTTRVVRPFQRNLVATMEQIDPGVTAESYVKRQIEGLRQAHVVREDVGEPETVLLAGGIKGLVTEQIIIGGTGERVRQMQLLTIKDGVAHTIILSHLDGKPFEAVRSEFRKMLLSVS